MLVAATDATQRRVWIYFLETWLFHLKHTNKRNCISTHLNSKRLWKIHKKPVDEIWNNCCCCLSNYRQKTERQTGEQTELCLRFSVTPCFWYNSLVTPLYSHGPWRQGVPVCGNRVVRMIETERGGGEDIFRRHDLQITAGRYSWDAMTNSSVTQHIVHKLTMFLSH